MRRRACLRGVEMACVAVGAFAMAAGVEAGGPQGRIVVANDEWTLSDSGFVAPSDPAQFARNCVEFLAGKRQADVLVYSSNFGLVGTQFIGALTSVGHQVTVTTQLPFTLETLLGFDVVFIGGLDLDDSVLISYVEAGGGVYFCGGTSGGGDLVNNDFLGHFGLMFSGLNGINGHIPIDPTVHPIFVGVDNLFQNNGSKIVDLDPSDDAEILVVDANGAGLYAVYDGGDGCSPTGPDLNGDSVVNAADLAILLGAWGPTLCGPDLDRDGAVGASDLAILLGAWG